MQWRPLLSDQLDFYWNVHFWPRIQGLTDDEYFWEPTLGAWNLRRGGDGKWAMDDLPVEPPVAPVTTIAWRIAHVGRDVLGKRARAFFAPGEVPEDVVMYDDQYWPEPLPSTAGSALDFLQEAYELWRDGVAALDEASLARPLGPRGGPYAEDSMAALILHINREVMAHGAEICLLRDLYRAGQDATDPVAAAVWVGDGAEVARLVAAGAEVRPSLLVEAAGRQLWGVVRALVEHGVDTNVGNPSALHYAAAAGDGEITALLVEHGADLASEDPQWQLTAAGWADFFGYKNLVSQLEAGDS